MERKLAIGLFILLTAGIAACAAWIAWMLSQYRPGTQAFTNVQLVWEVLRYAAA